jgi:protocatechuate 3,4-dioxygenase beta subunit
MSHDDDEIKGKLLSRRELLSVFGLGGVAAMVLACTGDDDDDEQSAAPAAGQATSTPAAGESATAPPSSASGTNTSESAAAQASATSLPSCIVLPELTEGPYFLDEKLERTDVRADSASGELRPGTPFVLTLNVLAVSGASCTPLEGAMVDVWHCDAMGAYSGFNDSAEGFNTVGEDWLRGFQYTDAGGRVEFTTIYPGWYMGRATHIHFKVRSDNSEFTAQFFFDDTLSDEVHSDEAPYAEKGAAGRRQNDEDNIYGESGGMLLLDVQRTDQGYAATFDIGIQL